MPRLLALLLALAALPSCDPTEAIADEVTGHVADHINEQVSSDFVEQYEIAKRGGDHADICVHAGLAAAGFLQSKDEVQYKRWLAIKKSDCRRR